MLKLLTCTRGHFWEVAVETGDAGLAGPCPECGASAESLPLLDLAPSEDAVRPAPPLSLTLPDTPLFADGLPIVGGYEVRERLGQGPTGVVFYRARQSVVNRPVLLKVVAARDDPGQKAWGSLRGEATALGRLQHPHIVSVYEAGERERQLFYNVVELMSGPTLAQKADRPMPFTQVVRLVEVLALAVHHAHAQGVHHRNLKPSSVLLQPLESADSEPPALPGEPPTGCRIHKRTYVPRLTDFGLCRRPIEGDVNDLELFGNEPGYLSPEQAWGRAREIGAITDVYGLGGILYFLLTGRAPFTGRDVQAVVEAVQTERLVPPCAVRRRVPAGLDAICRKCLSSQPHRRYGSARELADDLRRCAANLPIKGREVSSAQRFGLWLRRRPGVAVFLVLLMLGAIGLIVAYEAGHREGGRYGPPLTFTRKQEDTEPLRRRLEALEKQQRFNEYLAQLTRAKALLDKGMIPPAQEALERCPEDLRHWEWHYLARCLNDTRPITLVMPEPVSALAFHPTYRHAVAVAWHPREGLRPRGAVRLWKVSNRPQEELTLTDFEGPVRAITFRAGGQQLATASEGDGAAHLRVWDVRLEDANRGQLQATKTLPLTDLTDLAYSPDGAFLFAASGDGMLHKFRATTLESIISQFGQRNWRGNRVSMRLAVSADGKRLASLDRSENNANLWNALTRGYDRHLGGNVRALAFADSTRLAVGRTDRTVTIWDVAAGRVLHNLDMPAAVEQLAFSADGQRLAVALGDASVRVWGFGGTSWVELPVRAQAGSDGLVFSADHRLLATAAGKEVNLWGSLAQ